MAAELGWILGFRGISRLKGLRAEYEDGLALLLRVNSIPTTLIFDRDGKMISRMAGFDPSTFVSTTPPSVIT